VEAENVSEAVQTYRIVSVHPLWRYERFLFVHTRCEVRTKPSSRPGATIQVEGKLQIGCGFGLAELISRLRP
jgi:hypothetical protein